MSVPFNPRHDRSVNVKVGQGAICIGQLAESSLASPACMPKDGRDNWTMSVEAIERVTQFLEISYCRTLA